MEHGPGKAAGLKGNEKRDYYNDHFNLVNKLHEFAPFVIETQGGVGTTALKIIKAILKRKKERNLRSTTFEVRENEVMGGEILKKVIFESQRQMARTLLDKTSREDHILPKKLETQMVIAEAPREAAKTFRSEKLKVKPATVLNLGTLNLNKKVNSDYGNFSVRETTLKSELVADDDGAEAENKPNTRPNIEMTNKSKQESMNRTKLRPTEAKMV